MDKDINKNNIIDVDEKNFQNTVIEASDNKLILVDFWAPWCGPCKQLTPVLLDIAKENIEKITLAKVNIDENQQLAAQLRIQSIPAVFAFYKKQIVDRKRIKKVLYEIKKNSIKKKIDPKITIRIWSAMIKSYIDYERRKFKKK